MVPTGEAPARNLRQQQNDNKDIGGERQIGDPAAVVPRHSVGGVVGKETRTSERHRGKRSSQASDRMILPDIVVHSLDDDSINDREEEEKEEEAEEG